MIKNSIAEPSQSQLKTNLIELETYENGIVIVRMCDQKNKNKISAQLIQRLKESFEYIRQNINYKVVVLTGSDICFLDDSEIQATDNAVVEIQAAILKCDIPVIAAMTGNASGVGWLLGLCCDGTVYSNEGVYSSPDLACGRIPGGGATLLFPFKLGDYLGREILFTGNEYTGAQLEVRGKCNSAPQLEVENYAFEMAERWAALPQKELYQLKSELSQEIQGRISDIVAQEIEIEQQLRQSVPKIKPSTDVSACVGKPKQVDLDTEVVTLDTYDNGVVCITMHDQQNKNTFTGTLANGLIEVFEHIKNNSNYKVVILTGYENYFACGGSKEGLLAIQNGMMKFTDVNIYSLALECEIPVIAAMQGHGIGAGWAMGMFCDLVVFSEESVYVSNYMRYGFTPGAGATLIFPHRFGEDLAREILFAAREYKGHELRERGICMPVVPRSEVKNYAMEMASRLALSSRQALALLKTLLCQDVRNQLDTVFCQEVEMHEKTFVGNQEVLQKIQLHFNERTHEIEEPIVPVSVTHVIDKNEISLETIRNTLRISLADELYIVEESIDGDTQFIDMGLDSVTGVTWVRKLNAELDLSISATKVYDYPTINSFAAYVMDVAKQQGIILSNEEKKPTLLKIEKVDYKPGLHIDPFAKVLSESKVLPIQKKPRHIVHSKKIPQKPENENRIVDREKHQQENTQAIAIIGMSGQFPRSKNVAAFWDNLAHGRDCISDVPANRWSMDKYYDPDPNVPEKTYCNRMGVLEDIDKFDPLFFNISPAEAEFIEPQQRLFLENCWASLEDSALLPSELSGSRCGVFVGCGISDYGQGLTAQDLMGSAASILSSRISYLLNLKGPCMAIDTSCSSSLVAIAEACNSLVLGNSDLAFAGGVCILSGPSIHIMASKAGMLSKDGRCFTFDARANGFVPGEGVGVILLKRLSDAVRDQDPIAGVIRGWGVNQDGKTNGITAPSVNSQILLEKEIYQKFNISPETISLVEAHGTGTKLGDPIEAEALTESFRSFTHKENYCAIGSVKSNIGHLMPAAGVSGAIKVLLALKHKMLPPTINFKTLNEHISLDGSPFYVNTELKPWDVAMGESRRAAVSSFGFSGTNAHIVIEEYLPVIHSPIHLNMESANNPIPVDTHNPVLFVLSAKSEEQLKVYAESMKHYAQSHEELNLANMAYTLQVGRQAMIFRLAMLADSRQALLNMLDKFIKNSSSPGVMTAKVNKKKEVVSVFEADEDAQALLRTWIEKNKLKKIAQLWVNGLNIDWKQLYGDHKPQRINLSTYPFADERYWIGVTDRKIDSEAVTLNNKTLEVLEKTKAIDGSHYESDSDDSTENTKHYVLEKLTKILAKVTNISENRIDIDSDFEELGLDSIMITSLNNELEIWVGKLDATLFFKYKTLSSLADYLNSIFPSGVKRGKVKREQTTPITSDSLNVIPLQPLSQVQKSQCHIDPGQSEYSQNSDQAIAIIGMTGKYPLANNLKEFWKNLCEGRDCITEIPIERFDYRPLFSPEKGKNDSIYSKWGGFLDDIDKFDALFFNVSPDDARNMDPQERLFLESAWDCLESAGYIKPNWQKIPRNVGVFAGATFNNYQLIAADATNQRLLSPVNSQMFSIANHVSYFFNFTGPSLTLDTACSASLYAIHLACESIKRGECEMAIAGGVNLSLHPSKYFTLCSRGFAASDGRCHAFTEGGDGYVPSEGVGTVLLKPLGVALADGDQVLAVIKGTGVSHDGKTQNYTAPNPVSQTKAIEAALRQANINPESLSYVEAHGTGTALGDPIEITGLMDAFSKHTNKKQFCSIGSIKSNIGHGEAVAGITQLTKTVLQMQNKTLTPSVLHGSLNPNIDFKNSAFFVQDKKNYWEQPEIAGQLVSRRAGISSFGAGGVNVHVILEEHIREQLSRPKVSSKIKPTVIIPFSAQIQSQLSDMVKNLLAVCEDATNQFDLEDIAYTLQTRRAFLRFRLAFVVKDKSDLLVTLKGYLTLNQSVSAPIQYYEGDIKNCKTNSIKLNTSEEEKFYLKTLVENQETNELAQLWVNGTNIHWEEWYANQSKYRCLSLPTYPFLKKRYWISNVFNQQEAQTREQINKQSNKVDDPSAAVSVSNIITTHSSDYHETDSKSQCYASNENHSEGTSSALTPLLESIIDLSDLEREDEFNKFIEAQTKSVLGFSLEDSIDSDLGFFELGMESMQAVNLKQSIEKQLTFTLSDTALFDFPSIRSLSGHVLGIIPWEQLTEKFIEPSITIENVVNTQMVFGREELFQLTGAGNEDVLDNAIVADINNLSEEEVIKELLSELDL